MTHCLLSAGRFEKAAQLVKDADGFLEPGLGEPTPAYLSIYGTLFLTGAMSAARAEDRATAQEFLQEVETTASLLGADANHQDRIQLQATEIGVYDFHPLDVVADLTIPRLARRIVAAAAARTDGRVAYLEHGHAPEHGGRVSLNDCDSHLAASPISYFIKAARSARGDRRNPFRDLHRVPERLLWELPKTVMAERNQLPSFM
ncbi:hypothetical protein [Streptomyces tubercidicus]|uniref:hypothetical protein n=1 Tax=Streptomyces tubercidicus TaxID=47759 RepID=UPI0036827E1D